MIYTMPSEEAGREALDALARRFHVKHDDDSDESLVYHDTFDWRLFRAGVVLSSVRGPQGRGQILSRYTRDADRPVHRLELASSPAFARDFPEGPWRRELEPILEMRCLMAMLELTVTGRTLHVLGDEDKTVARLRLRYGRAEAPFDHRKAPLPVTLKTVELRGYSGEHRELVRFLESDLGLEPSPQDEMSLACAAVGRAPGDYSSKLRLRLEGEQCSDEAAVRTYRSLLETLLRNEEGTRRDLDSEFLHDFRVAVRRTRSALTQLPQVFPPQVVEHFKGEFKWLGTVTGPTRDLDVYQLKIDDYEAALPPEIRSDLEPLRDFLVRHQKIEQQRLVKHLDSARYRELIRAWGQFLTEAPQSLPPAANAARPIAELSAERTWKAYRRVLKKGGAIDEDTPAQALHDLRIDCKKLRYLLEFFKSLHPLSEIDPLIKALKYLQDNLGDFNDLEVQQGQLREYAHQMEKEGKASADTLLAMGELVAGLRRLQHLERLKFAERFTRFTAKNNQRAFRRLFKPDVARG